MLDDNQIRKGFEKKYFIPSHINFNVEAGSYKSKYEGRGEVFKKLAIQTNNMFSIWKDACLYACSIIEKP